MSVNGEPTIPVLEDNDHKGVTRTEAIFGDKEARLLVGMGVQPTENLDEVHPGDEDAVEELAGSPVPESTERRAAIAALNQAASAGSWDQERINLVQQDIDHKFPV